MHQRTPFPSRSFAPSIRTIVLGLAATSLSFAVAGPAPAAPVGEDPVRAAIDAGVDWLIRHQAEEGYWKAGEGESLHDVGATALAIRTLRSAAKMERDRDPQIERAIDSGIQYLLSVHDEETGCFGLVNSHQAFLYDHAIATVAVAERCQDQDGDAIRKSAQRAVNFIHASRNPYKAWRYSYPPDGNNDTSVTGWMVAALHAAANAGLKVDRAALEGARMYLDEMTDPKTWRTGYISRGGYSAREPGTDERWAAQDTEAMTAVALLARLDLGVSKESDAVMGAAQRLVRLPPTWELPGRVDICYWHHGTDALSRIGAFPIWTRALVRAAQKGQLTGGDDRGSWDPGLDPWGHRGGRAYTTALMTRALIMAAPTAAAVAVAGRVPDVVPLIEDPRQGEPLRFAIRGGGDSLTRFRIFVGTRSGESHADVDADAFPFARVGLIVEVRPDGATLHATGIVPRDGQRAAFTPWAGVGMPDTSKGVLRFQVQAIGAGDELLWEEACPIELRPTPAARTISELRAAALSAVAVALPGGSVMTSRPMVTGKDGLRQVTYRATGADGVVGLYRVELDDQGVPQTITTHALAEDLFGTLWPEAGRVVFGGG